MAKGSVAEGLSQRDIHENVGGRVKAAFPHKETPFFVI
jgi:hypothetical protein